ncbi:MAG: hypothetical protein CO039_02295, partial [Candidatus Pacebacteria bacterium CG_4_9_14_0_2_um_filter_34_50]
MQPHTGATFAALVYLTPSILRDPLSFGGQIFNIRTTIYSSNGTHLYNKYHLIETIRNNIVPKELEFKAGKDYACYMKVRYDSKFEKFEFIKHTHTTIDEEFVIYIDGSLNVTEKFSGKYVSETYIDHKIKGRRFNDKRIEFQDTFKLDKYSNSETVLKYVM